MANRYRDDDDAGYDIHDILWKFVFTFIIIIRNYVEAGTRSGTTTRCMSPLIRSGVNNRGYWGL